MANKNEKRFRLYQIILLLVTKIVKPSNLQNYLIICSLSTIAKCDPYYAVTKGF